MKISNYQPDTLDDAIKYLYDNLTPEDIKFIKSNDHSTIHHFGGMQMRNEGRLWDKKSKINRDIQKRFGLAHGDDISNLIFDGLWTKVKHKNVEKALEKCANRCKKHWKDSGFDAMTGEPLNPSPTYTQQQSILIKLKKDGAIEIL
jgi:hypothetical protein